VDGGGDALLHPPLIDAPLVIYGKSHLRTRLTLLRGDKGGERMQPWIVQAGISSLSRHADDVVSVHVSPLARILFKVV
jgi:hypothetical protein